MGRTFILSRHAAGSNIDIKIPKRYRTSKNKPKKYAPKLSTEEREAEKKLKRLARIQREMTRNRKLHEQMCK